MKTAPGRIEALDALRGALALVVALTHIAITTKHDLPLPPLLRAARMTLVCSADAAVFAFFVMSGYVLARAYSDTYVRFMFRRAVRLVPTGAVCLAIGLFLFENVPALRSMMTVYAADNSPLPGGSSLATTPDAPIWSLYVELAVTPVLPLLFWAARWPAAMLACAIGLIPVLPPMVGLWLLCFAVGVALTRRPIAWPAVTNGPLLWLGRISFSLYLSHYPIVSFCSLLPRPVAPIAALALCLPLAWVVWRFVELPSLRWSRRVAAVDLRLLPHRGKTRRKERAALLR